MPPEIAAAGRQHPARPGQGRGRAAVASTAELVEQRGHASSRSGDKRALLGRAAAATARSTARSSSRAPSTAPTGSPQQLASDGIAADAIHGNKSQSARDRALERFKHGTGRVLVATDIAARGIDVEGITHVINYDLPNVPESYVHRIGRTARAGAERRRDLVLRCRGARVPARYRGADQDARSRSWRTTRGIRARARRRARHARQGAHDAATHVQHTVATAQQAPAASRGRAFGGQGES